MAYQHGLFSWVDLTAADPEQAKEFYSALFGWEAEDQNDPDGNYIYTMFNLDGKVVAGLGPQPPGMAGSGVPSVWNSYVTVDNLAATVDGWALARGTVIMPPMDVMTAGRMAVVADPEGAVISLWEAKDHAGAEVFNAPGALSWNELNTRDTAAAREFYGKTLGWEFEEFPMEGQESYWVIVIPGKAQELPLTADPYNGGILAIGPTFPPDMPAHWSVYFTTADIERDVKKVTDLGGSIAAGPMNISAGTIAVVSDPQGGYFTIIEPPAAG